MIKVNKKYYLVHFDYLENLYRKNFTLRTNLVHTNQEIN